LTKFIVVGVTTVLVGALALPILHPHPAAAGPVIAYPDLRINVPVSSFSIANPTPSTRTLDFTHVTWNAGTGPLEIRPNYNPTTGIAEGYQALYTMTSPGQWSFVSTVPIARPMVWDPPIDYRFPLSAFALYSIGSDGGVGGVVATSPKVDFCITEDTHVGGVPNSPATANYSPGDCDSPNGILGLSVGWGDEYDSTDPGQNIDVTSVPDGTYWLRATVDPYHLLEESNASNNTTDTEIAITGNKVTVVKQVSTDSTPPTVAVTSPSSGANLSGTINLQAAVSGPNPITNVQWLLDGLPIGPALTAAPYSLAWNSTAATPGPHILTAQALDAEGFYGTAPAVPITVEQQVGGFAVDSLVSTQGNSTATTGTFSTTSPGDLLVALVASDANPFHTGQQSVTVSGAGLTWKRVVQSNTEHGDSEIWTATSPAVLNTVTVTSTPSQTGYNQLLTVVAVTGASGVGASSSAGAGTGAPSITMKSTAAGSWALAVGNDFDNAIARTLGAGQNLLSAWTSTSTGDTYWAQSATTLSSSAGQSLTLSDTAPTTDQWNLAAVEVLPASGTPPPPPPPPPTVSIISPSPNQTVTGTVPVTASASSTIGVASVQLLVDGLPFGPLLTTAPYAVNWDTTSVANGTHNLSAIALDTQGQSTTAAAVPVMVQNAVAPPPCFVMDTKVVATGHGALTTTAFHTAAPGELLLAFVGSDGPSKGTQKVTVTGAGLTWSLVSRADSQLGDAEIWTATTTSTLSGATVTSAQSVGTYDQSLTVIALQGTSGTGATATAGARTGAPAVTVTTTYQNSLVFGVGNDWDNALARTVGTNQVSLSQWVDTSTGDTYWVQSTSSPPAAAGAVTLSDTAPTTDRWNFAAVEVIGQSTGQLSLYGG